MSDEMKLQWCRYRREIDLLIKIYPDKNIKDYFSEDTLKEIENKNPFEGMDG